MQDADKGSAGELSGEGLRIAIVRARFNEPVTARLAERCIAELLALGLAPRDVVHVTVPGALEIPVALRRWPRTATTTRWSRWAASSAARPTTSSSSPTRAAPASRAYRWTTGCRSRTRS
jgi:hypothetical protein